MGDVDPPFLAARRGNASDVSDALLLGVPLDGGVSFRSGAREGPSGIRRFSESIESYSPRARSDLEDLTVVDIGDADGDPETAADRVLEAAWTGNRRPLLVTLGGDHSVTPPLVRAVALRCERPALVAFDAHLDLRERYEGDHACTFRRVVDAGVPTFVFGVRSGAREEWADAERLLHYASPHLELPHTVWPLLETSEVYLTIDIDVLDPSIAPGTGNPEPGGPTFLELLRAVESIKGLNVVALDLVEVSPPLDPSGVTQTAAAILVRELLLRFVRR